MTEPRSSPDTTARVIFDILNPVALAVENLASHQDQCDQDGVMVMVSRQALDEVLEAINQLAIAAAQDALSGVAQAQSTSSDLRAAIAKIIDPVAFSALEWCYSIPQPEEFMDMKIAKDKADKILALFNLGNAGSGS